MTIIGIDYGLARIGLAVAKAPLHIAIPYQTVVTKGSIEKQIEDLLTILVELNPVEIVVGLPLMLNGKDSSMTKAAREFAKKLQENFPVPIHLQDERLTTSYVDKQLKYGNKKRKERNSSCDPLSACVILQNFLDQRAFLKTTNALEK